LLVNSIRQLSQTHAYCTTDLLHFYSLTRAESSHFQMQLMQIWKVSWFFTTFCGKAKGRFFTHTFNVCILQDSFILVIWWFVGKWESCGLCTLLFIFKSEFHAEVW